MTTRTKVTRPVPPIAHQRPGAAAALDMSVDSFDRYVKSEVKCIRRGVLRLYPVADLERWCEENAEWVFDHD